MFYHIHSKAEAAAVAAAVLAETAAKEAAAEIANASPEQRRGGHANRSGRDLGPNGHDYRRDDNGTVQVDEDKVNQMLADRLQSKFRKDYSTFEINVNHDYHNGPS